MCARVTPLAKSRWSVVRRLLGLIFSIYFCAATIKTACRACDANGCGSLITNLTFWAWAVHCLYFSSQIELSHQSHTLLREFNTVLHALSLGLSFYVAVAVSVLFMYAPPPTSKPLFRIKIPRLQVQPVVHAATRRRRASSSGHRVVLLHPCALCNTPLLPHCVFVTR